MSSTTVTKTVDVLRHVFSAYSLPDQLVSDNGPRFTAEDFATFMCNDGVKHIRSAPYHPASNGLAERYIQSLKTALKASKDDGRSLSHRLSSFLFIRTCSYNPLSPHATMGVSTTSLFLKGIFTPDLSFCNQILSLLCWNSSPHRNPVMIVMRRTGHGL